MRTLGTQTLTGPVGLIEPIRTLDLSQKAHDSQSCALESLHHLTIEDLPDELLEAVVWHLPPKSRPVLRLVNRHMRTVATRCIKSCKIKDIHTGLSAAITAFPFTQRLKVKDTYHSTNQCSLSMQADAALTVALTTACYHLRSLHLTHCCVTDQSVALISQLPSLQSLYLDSIEAVTAGLAGMGRLHHLRSLTLRYLRVDQKSVMALFKDPTRGLMHLTHLELAGIELDGASVDWLIEQLGGLESVCLENMGGVTDSTLAKLCSKNNLRALKLANITSQPGVTDASLQLLAQSDCPIASLELWSLAQVSHVGILAIAHKPSLRELLLAYLPRIKFFSIQSIKSITTLTVTTMGMRTW